MKLNRNFEKDIKEIIDFALKGIRKYSPEAAQLVFRTGMAESGYRQLSQYGGGPGVGYFQVEENTIRDISENFLLYRPEQKAMVMGFGFDDTGAIERVKGSIILQAIFCRYTYWRAPAALPKLNDSKAQAEYWKKWYNTEGGKGTPEHFLEANGIIY